MGNSKWFQLKQTEIAHFVIANGHLIIYGKLFDEGMWSKHASVW